MRIALLDDDRSQSEVISHVVTGVGHSCQSFQTGWDLLTHLRRESADMLIIDWQVADASGAEVLRWVRDKMPPGLPVLFLAGRSAEDDIVAALAAGANDYIIKPIRRGELVTRVQALLRRAYPTQSAFEQIQFDQYVFEVPTGRLSMAGKQIELTQKEFDLALLLFQNLGRPLSRAYIQEAIWSREGDVPSRTMDTHISRVRNKLHLKPENGFRLTPVYSYGYRLEQMPQSPQLSK
jgi:DNA-binding response OmpR family regulator